MIIKRKGKEYEVDKIESNIDGSLFIGKAWNLTDDAPASDEEMDSLAETSVFADYVLEARSRFK